MFIFKFFLPFISLVTLFPIQGFGNLSCRYINSIQDQFLKNHILYSKITPTIKKRVLNNFLKDLDREKIYFLKSDIKSIEKRNHRLLSNIKNRNCSDLYHIYNIYSKRVKERLDFAKKYLDKNFKFKPNLTYILDEDQKTYPSSERKANRLMEAYLQYQVANIFLIENDLQKSINHIFHIFKNISKQVTSWKPQLNPKELRECIKKSNNSFQSCKPTKWFSLYLNSFAQSLDSHSSYLTREEVEDFNISMNLSLEGIGATLSSRFGYTIIENLVPGGAAFKSKKLKRKDKILAVGQQSKKKLINVFGERIEDVVSIIRGKKGTPVYLKILRENKKKQKSIFTVKIIRSTVDLVEEAASIDYVKKTLKNHSHTIGIIKVPSFYGSGRYGKSVTTDIKNLLNKAKKKQISSLVLDLSNNRGGSLDEAVSLAGLFFAEGNVVKQSEKNYKSPVLLMDRDPRIFYKGDLVVLVNRLSASASEIVSGTLQNYNRAVIVGGDHTFGKGSVQSVEHLRNHLGALKTTVGLYFIPSGKSTQKRGVISDISLPSIFNLNDIGEKNLDYTLPEQSIADFKSPPKEIFSNQLNKNWKPISSKTISYLKLLSKKRVAVNKDFKKILAQIKKIESKNKKRIKISKVLNKKDDDMEDIVDREDLYNSKKSKERYLKRADVQEAANIALDLASLHKTVLLKKARLPKK